MSESLIPLSNVHFRHITHVKDDRSQVFLSQGACHFLWRQKQINQMQEDAFALQSTEANKRSVKHFRSSHRLQNTTRFQSRSSCWSNDCVNTERPSRAQRAREQRRREDGVRCGGTCTHGEVLLQRVSMLLLQVDRKEVGRGCDSDGKSADTDKGTWRHQRAKQWEHGKSTAAKWINPL